MKERSLVTFTILSQMAVGALWTLVILRAWVTRQAGVYVADALTAPLQAIGPVMIVAMLASFFHLGTPLNAWRAFANLRSSWLSREILFAVLFTGSSVLLAGLWCEPGTFAVRDVVAWAAALIGLALIVSMSNSYRLRTIPAWDTWITPVSFFATTFLLGALAASVTLVVNPNAPPELTRIVLRWIALVVAVTGIVELAITLLWAARLASGSEAAKRAVARITQEHGPAFTWSRGLLLVGILITSAGMSLLEERWTGIIFILALGLALISEVLGRRLFYEARVRQGV